MCIKLLEHYLASDECNGLTMIVFTLRAASQHFPKEKSSHLFEYFLQ